MAVYSGKYTVQLDAKGRVILPAPLRKIAELEDPSKSFFLTQFEAGCLHLYTAVGFNQRVDRIRTSLRTIADKQEKQNKTLQFHRFLHSSHPVSLSEQGRLQVPSEIVTESGFTADSAVLVVGSDIVIEIWEPRRYTARFAAINADPAKSDAELRELTDL